MRKASTLIGAALVAGALFAGCGGGDSSDTTATALSKAEYQKQGNAICAKGNKVIAAQVQKQFKNGQPTQQQIEQFATETAIPTIQNEIDQLRALPAPSGDEATVNAIYDAAQQGIDAAKKDPSIIAQDNPQAFAKANKLAKAYGLGVCGSA